MNYKTPVAPHKAIFRRKNSSSLKDGNTGLNKSKKFNTEEIKYTERGHAVTQRDDSSNYRFEHERDMISKERHHLSSTRVSGVLKDSNISFVNLLRDGDDTNEYNRNYKIYSKFMIISAKYLELSPIDLPPTPDSPIDYHLLDSNNINTRHRAASAYIN